MKHLKREKEFHRERNQRKALIFGLLSNFILHEEIKTSEAKAKEVKRLIDRIVNEAKKSQDSAKKFLVIRYLEGKISTPAIKKITGDFVKKFSGRESGYARVIKLGARKSDASEMALVKFVE
jgi:large subunit ribosomal protein L17